MPKALIYMKFTSAYRVRDRAAQLQPGVAGIVVKPVKGKSAN